MLLFEHCVVGQNRKYSSSPNLKIDGVEVNSKNRWVELEITEIKVIGNSQGSMTSATFSLIQLKQLAVSDALLKSKSDVLVAPFYVVKTENNMVYVEVRGFPANYKKLN